MPTKNYDIRLYGRRRCSNCWWHENGLCYAVSTEFHKHYVDASSWCPDWASKRIEEKEGSYLRDNIRYKNING